MAMTISSATSIDPRRALRPWLPALLAATLILAGCATVAPPPPAPTQAPEPGAPAPVEGPSLGWFSRIKVPDGNVPVLKLAATGAQVFRCEQHEGRLSWVFRLPEASLFDDSGLEVGRHGANFSFEHTDGSRVIGTVAAYEDGRSDRDLRWLLMSARSFGNGALTGVSYIQRINTKGGQPPERCDTSQLNQLLRVDFTADFVFYKPR